jgi:hypothetical protein
VLSVGSGLIYAAIIVMWALYFIPRWLRRHEELSESRSVEKFDHAMRILSRREPTPDQRYIVMPPKPEPVSAAAVASPTSALSALGPAPRLSQRGPSELRSQGRSSQGRSSRGRSSMAIRRRRVLAALVLLTIIVAAVTPVTPIPWWGPAVGVLVTLVDLAHLRVQARRRRELTRNRHAVRKRLRSRLHRVNSTVRLAEARQLLAERRAAAEAERVEADWAAHEAARRDAERAGGWQPTPVPLPTYVTKPVAPRVGRPIDLTHPGAWTDAQSGVAAAPSPGRATAEEIFDQTSDAGRPAPTAAEAAGAQTAGAQAAGAQTAGAQTAGAQAAGAQTAGAQTAGATSPSYADYAAELDEILERRRAVND